MFRALLAILLIIGAAACEERAAAPPVAGPSPALWVVEDAAGETRGWLFGTIHALPDDSPWTTPALETAIREAGVLVVEVRDLDTEGTAAIFNQMARDEPAPPLAERLAPADRRHLSDLLAREGLSSAGLDGLESWAAALALARLGDVARASGGVDFALIARFSGRPVAELEGAADQLAIFDALPERDQRRLLSGVLAEQADPEAQLRDLAALWLAGDLAGLERATRRGLLADPALYRALSAGRNADWARALAPLLERGNRPLVAVGAAHMLGEDGLPALLAAQGYSVRRIQ